MATYYFETMTAAQALAFTANDKITLQTPAYDVGTYDFDLKFVPASSGVSEHVDITYNGRTVSFGTGIYGTSQYFLDKFRDWHIANPNTGDFIRGADSTSDLFHTNTYFTGGGNDTVLGGNGYDVIYAGDGNDSVDGGAFVDNRSDQKLQESINGGSGNDTISAHGAVIIDGGSGNDLIFGGQTVSGGSGNDTIIASSQDQIQYGRYLYEGGEGNDSIQGSDKDEIITAGSGNNTISASNGDDLVGVGYSPGVGAFVTNIVDGGAGSDFLAFEFFGNATVDMNAGIATYGSATQSGIVYAGSKTAFKSIEMIATGD